MNVMKDYTDLKKDYKYNMNKSYMNESQLQSMVENDDDDNNSLRMQSNLFKTFNHGDNQAASSNEKIQKLEAEINKLKQTNSEILDSKFALADKLDKE